MSDHNLLSFADRHSVALNQFISAHNLSLTSGVMHFRIAGTKAGSVYEIVWDMRTHPLSLFTNATKPEIMHNKETETRNKLYASLREKFNEASRPFIPRFYSSPESYRQLKAIENEISVLGLGKIRVEKNRPVYSPLAPMNYSENPVLSLILLVPSVYAFFSLRDEFKEFLVGRNVELVPQLDYLQFIVEKEGQGVLSDLAFRYTQNLVVSDVAPKASSEIPFQEFISKSNDYKVILDVDEFTDSDAVALLRDIGACGRYALVKRTNHSQQVLVSSEGFKVKAWIAGDGTLYQLTQSGLIVVKPNESKLRVIGAKDDQSLLTLLSTATLILYSTLEPIQAEVAENATEIEYQIVGEFEAPELKVVSAIPFRDPMSCTQAQIEDLKETDFPLLAQYKLDGNRILVYVLDSGNTIKYYSRNGILQTAKFNQLFDQSVRELFTRLPEGVNNVMLDCECYCHEVVHSEIGGWCNRIETSVEFQQLHLYLLSWLDFDALVEVKERGRNYTISPLPFSQSLANLERLIDLQSKIRLNRTYQIANREELFSLMARSVNGGYEGLVLYPMGKRYTFGNAGLKKVKKFYDGECRVIGYEESKTEAGVIGSVQVQVKAWFGKAVNNPAYQENEEDEQVFPMLTFSVSAALRNEVKSGSMTSEVFQQCIGKDFTIICGSFSDAGVPIHARFKSAFGIENQRLDHL